MKLMKNNPILLFLFSLLFLFVLPGCTTSIPTGSVDLPSGSRMESSQNKVAGKDEGVKLNLCATLPFIWGRYLYVHDELEDALLSYSKALNCDPDNRYIFMARVGVLWELGRFAETEKILRDYLSTHGDDDEIRTMLAGVLFHLQKYDESEREYLTVYKHEPSKTEILLALSELYFTSKQVDKSVGALDEFLAKADEPCEAHSILARIFATKGDNKKAIKHYKQALECDWSPELAGEMATLYQGNGKYKKAEKIYRHLISLDSGDERAVFSLVSLYMEQGKDREARETLNSFIKNNPGSEQTRILLARLYGQGGDFDQAIDVLNEVLADNEENQEACFYMGIFLINEDKPAEALKYFELIKPDSELYEDAFLLRAQVLTEQQKYRQAVTVIEEGLDRWSGKGGEVFGLLTWLYEKLEMIDKAESSYLRALKLYPDDDKLLFDYGLFLARQDKMKQALAIMEKVIEFNPEHAEALNYVGYSWADENRNLDKALEYIKKAVAMQPDNAAFLDSLGWVYFRLGEFDKALPELERSLQLKPDEPEIIKHYEEVKRALAEDAGK